MAGNPTGALRAGSSGVDSASNHIHATATPPKSLFDAWVKRSAGFGALQPTLIYGGAAWQALWAGSSDHPPHQKEESGVRRPGVPE